jgi:hypothetical protein
VKDYRETGAVGLNQTIQQRDFDQASMEVGLRGRFDLQNVSFDGAASWVADLDASTPAIRTALVSVPDVVRALPAATREDGHGRVSLGVSVPVTEHVAFSLRGASTIGADTDDWNAFLVLAVRH